MRHSSPPASKASALLARFAEASMKLPRGRAWFLVLASFAATLCVDRFTGPQINLLVVYMALSCVAAWCLGERIGMAIGLASVAGMSLVNGFYGAFPMQGHQLPLLPTVWNTIGRAAAFVLLVMMASGMRHALDLASTRASTDALTGALNREALTRGMEGMIARAKRRGEALLIAYVDLDGFKAVNDRFGHSEGDVLLCRFAAAAERAVRASDLFARIGGDEFVMLLALDKCAQGDIVAERLHHQLSDALRKTGHDVTCSVGALVLDGRQVTTGAALIDAADSLMYEVKRAGKNALRVARGDLQPVALLRNGQGAPSGIRKSAA